MLTCRIIPCLDIKDGRVVKGVNFVNLRDAGDPLQAACYYAAQGADELCFLDITASSDRRQILVKLVEQIASNLFIPFTVGGGLRSISDIDLILHSGADKVSLNTAAFLRPQLLSEAAGRYGSQCIVCAVDARRNVAGGYFETYLHGGRTATGRDAIDWCREAEAQGAGEILLTSMDRDGTKKGYDLELIRAVRAAVQLPVIASGGVGSPQHFLEAVEETGSDALLAASIFHFREHTIGEVKEIMARRGIAVRLSTEWQ